jgi:hypothetical protein
MISVWTLAYCEMGVYRSTSVSGVSMVTISL